MNHWSKYIEILYGIFLGPGDPSLLNEVPGVTNNNALKGT